MSRLPVSFHRSARDLVGYFCILQVCFCLIFPIEIGAYTFKNQLSDRSTRTFHHWNTKKKKVTGYTVQEYHIDSNTGELLETSRNLDEKRRVYTEKTMWFNKESGELIKYQEEDFRSKLRTVNTYTKDRIQTQIWEKGEKREFEITITSELVPFEVLSQFLKSQINHLLEKKSIHFTLYLPIVAVELTKKGLPLSLSQLRMKAAMKKRKIRETLFGKKEVVTIRVEPTSFFVKALLGEEKSNFDFYFISQPPYTLVQFDEGDTSTRMIKPF
jgi:hypothetical protein